MIDRLGALALIPAQAAAQVPPPPAGLQVAADISMVVLAGISALLLLLMFTMLLQLRKLLATLQNQMQPVADRARAAAENVEYISAVVREDVQKVHSSVAGLADRLKEASGRMEERVEEFNALMDVVQDEAESVLLDTAAAVRGVRAGAKTMGEGIAPVHSGAASEPSDPPAEASVRPEPQELHPPAEELLSGDAGGA